MISYENKPRTNEKFSIGLDLDGTSGAFHKVFREAILNDPEYADFPIRTPRVYSYVDAGLFEDMPTFLNVLNRATDEGICARMLPYVGFRKHLTRLVEEDGAYVKVITSRPDSAMDDTLLWLTEVAQVPFHEVHITHEKTQIEADVYLDDHPGHISAFRGLGRNAIVFDQPYNREIPASVPRVKKWSEVPVAVKQAL